MTTDDQLARLVKHHDQLISLAGLECHGRHTVPVPLIVTGPLGHLPRGLVLGFEIADDRFVLDRSDVGES